MKTNRILRLLFWESTIKCNLSCAHCRRLESDEAVDSDMDTEQAKMMIRQLSDIADTQKFRPVLVFSGGEPLCRDDIFNLIEYARAKELPTALATNGTLIDKTIAQKIYDSGAARVAVSLDGANARVHDGLRRQAGAFDKALAGIKNLRASNVPFQINVTFTKQNSDQLDDIYELAKSLGAAAMHIFMLVPVGCGLTLAKTDMLSPQQYEQMLVAITQLESKAEIELKVTCGPHYQRIKKQQGISTGQAMGSKGCLAGLGVLFVGHAGNVFPCGYLPINCGNILEKDMIEIWNTSKELARMRDTSALEGKCGICGYKDLCGGCRARAYAATGNYLAEEPFCVYLPPKATGGH